MFVLTVTAGMDYSKRFHNQLSKGVTSDCLVKKTNRTISERKGYGYPAWSLLS